MRWMTIGTATVWLLFATGRPAAAQITTDPNPPEHEWVAAGFAGPTFGESVDEADAGLGGSLSYLYRRSIGAEVLASFTPDFDFATGATAESSVNDYMANVIAAVPLGDTGQVQPFISGGIGAMRLRADVDMPAGIVEVEDTQLGTNVGAGLMLFDERWGIRTDFRYFTGLTDEGETDPADILDPADLLGDTSFWRYNLGVAYRW